MVRLTPAEILSRSDNLTLARPFKAGIVPAASSRRVSDD
jgi:hypothetical protein